jgi:hypothetical protein
MDGLNKLHKDDLQTTRIKLTDALGKDSASMKILAGLTALFLPGTFMAVCIMSKNSVRLTII